MFFEHLQGCWPHHFPELKKQERGNMISANQICLGTGLGFFYEKAHLVIGCRQNHLDQAAINLCASSV